MFIFLSTFLSYAARLFSEKQAHYVSLADLFQVRVPSSRATAAAHGPRSGGDDEEKRLFSPLLGIELW
jgi:hypothetical protein